MNNNGVQCTTYFRVNWPKTLFHERRRAGSLQIMESQETDQGKYECVAHNAVGTEYSYSAQLYVRGETMGEEPLFE